MVALGNKFANIALPPRSGSLKTQRQPETLFTRPAHFRLPQRVTHPRPHTMHQFSIHAPDGEHLGFLVMLADDETRPQPESGQLALQIQPAAKNTALARLAQAQTLYWQFTRDHVRIHDEDGDYRANIRQEWLIIGGEHYQLTDLEGSL